LLRADAPISATERGLNIRSKLRIDMGDLGGALAGLLDSLF